VLGLAGAFAAAFAIDFVPENEIRMSVEPSATAEE
jgi:hypothetical protein